MRICSENGADARASTWLLPWGARQPTLVVARWDPLGQHSAARKLVKAATWEYSL